VLQNRNRRAVHLGKWFDILFHIACNRTELADMRVIGIDRWQAQTMLMWKASEKKENCPVSGLLEYNGNN
jgi:hypothetical protein